jgi:hypothetical protein
MLEAAFAAWLVALFGDRIVKGTGRLLLGSPEERRLREALAKALEVAVSAILLDVPAEAQAALGAALCERFSLAPVVVFDGRTRVRDGLLAAVREQLAPLDDPQNTTSGTSFLSEIAVDGSRLADEFAEVAIRSIEQVSPHYPGLAPLAAQLNADSAAGRDEELADKVNAILALLEALMQAPRGNAAGRELRSHSPGDHEVADALDRIVDAILATQSFRDDSTRNEVLFSLPEPLRSAIPRSARPRVQAYQLVQTCGSYPHGLRDLVSVLRAFERDSREMRDLDSVILQISPMPEGDSGGFG